jgi:hypothetical protein
MARFVLKYLNRSSRHDMGKDGNEECIAHYGLVFFLAIEGYK